VENRIGWCNC